MSKEAAIVLGSALIWGIVIIAAANVLKGTEFFSQLLPILAGGAGASLVVVSACLKKKTEQ